VAGSCEHGNEHSGSINAGNFLNRRDFAGFSGRNQFHADNSNGNPPALRQAATYNLFCCIK
jgi:hypothetical protein